VRKWLICVPMMTVLLLSGCTGGGVSEAEELALTIRAECLQQTAWTTEASITADYGQRVYQYEVTASWDGAETTLILTAPETVAGLTARLRDGENRLEYEDVSLETGPLNEDGLSPVAALPVLWETARSGYITACGLEENGLLRVDYGDPEGTPGRGTESTLWFQADTHALTAGEIRVDGFRVIRCDFTDFKMG